MSRMSIRDLLTRLGAARRAALSDPVQPPAMISCEEALAVLYEYLDGELPPSAHASARAHFEICGRCYPQLRTEESFRAAVRTAAQGQTAPPELRGRVLQLLRDAGASNSA